MAAPTVATMMKEIYSFCRTTPLIVSKVVESMNRCINLLSEEYHLGALKDTDTVATTVSKNYSSLPADFHKTVFYAYNDDTEEEVDVYEMTEDLWKEYFSALDEAGDAEAVCAENSTLYYQKIPETSQDIIIHFYKKHTALTLSSSFPDMFPDNLAEPLLVNFTVAEFLSKQKLTREVMEKIKFHNARYLEAKEALRTCSSNPAIKRVRKKNPPPKTFRI